MKLDWPWVIITESRWRVCGGAVCYSIYLWICLKFSIFKRPCREYKHQSEAMSSLIAKSLREWALFYALGDVLPLMPHIEFFPLTRVHSPQINKKTNKQASFHSFVSLFFRKPSKVRAGVPSPQYGLSLKALNLGQCLALNGHIPCPVSLPGVLIIPMISPLLSGSVHTSSRIHGPCEGRCPGRGVV